MISSACWLTTPLIPATPKEGKVRAKEHLTEGIQNAGAAFVEMMKGGNVGKAVVKVVTKDPFPVK